MLKQCCYHSPRLLLLTNGWYTINDDDDDDPDGRDDNYNEFAFYSIVVYGFARSISRIPDLIYIVIWLQLLLSFMLSSFWRRSTQLNNAIELEHSFDSFRFVSSRLVCFALLCCIRKDISKRMDQTIKESWQTSSRFNF